MDQPGYHDALRVLRQDAGGDLHRVLAAAGEPVSARDPVVYLVDFAHQVLFPLAAGEAEQAVAGTMAGRAFATGQPVSAERDGSVRVWVPVVEQTTRTGVLAVTVPQASPETLEQAGLLGVFAGLVVAAAARVSDTPYLRRQGRAADGELFGLDRLIDLLEREAASGQPAEELLRRLVRAVLDHQPGGLRDDATLLLVQWTGT